MTTATIFACVAGLTLASAAPSLAQDARVYLTWRAPYGAPRATDLLNVPCVDDTATRDTLYVSFQTGRHAPNLFGMEGALLFRAPLGDTLGPNWFFGGGVQNPRNVRVEWLRDSTSFPGIESAWKVNGTGLVNFTRTREVGRLQMMYAVPHPAPVRDSVTYAFARVTVPRALTSQAGCDRPLCIEWTGTHLAFELYEPEAHHGSGSRRFVGLNSATVCRAFQGARAVPAWRPDGKSAP